MTFVMNDEQAEAIFKHVRDEEIYKGICSMAGEIKDLTSVDMWGEYCRDLMRGMVTFFKERAVTEKKSNLILPKGYTDEVSDL